MSKVPSAAVAAAMVVAVALALGVAACGGATDGPTSATGAASAVASPAAGPGANGSPAPDVVTAEPVRHAKVGDLDVGYRTIGPLGAAADSTPLLMIMGSSGTMDMWSPHTPATPAAAVPSPPTRRPWRC